MENDQPKLSAPRAVFKAKSFNAGNKISSKTPVGPSSVSNFDLSLNPSRSPFQNTMKPSKRSTNFDSTDIERDFEELEIKSEIFKILKSNTGDFFKNSTDSRSTAFSRIHIHPDISEDLNLEDVERMVIPPARSKNPLSSILNNDFFEDDKPLQVNFSKYFLKNEQV